MIIMAVNKIIYNKKTLIDLTNDTVTADKLFKGVLAHDKSGNQIVGTFEQSLPTGTKTITANGTYDVTDYAKATVNVPVPSGYVKPSGTKSITTTSSVDVTSYATAQIQSSTLTAENIKKDISILGVVGTYEGSGGGGSSLETCTITIDVYSNGPMLSQVGVIYTNEKQELLDMVFKASTTITCLKNSVFCTNDGGYGGATITVSGEVTKLSNFGASIPYAIYGNATITAE